MTEHFIISRAGAVDVPRTSMQRCGGDGAKALMVRARCVHISACDDTWACGVASRIYTGEGYMPSLTLTLGERHITSYIAYLTASLESKFRLVNLFI